MISYMLEFQGNLRTSFFVIAHQVIFTAWTRRGQKVGPRQRLVNHINQYLTPMKHKFISFSSIVPSLMKFCGLVLEEESATLFVVTEARNGLFCCLMPALLFFEPKYSDSSFLWYENHHFPLRRERRQNRHRPRESETCKKPGPRYLRSGCESGDAHQ